jgi:hypothetical protein
VLQQISVGPSRHYITCVATARQGLAQNVAGVQYDGLPEISCVLQGMIE